MTLFNTSYNSNILGNLYSARGRVIRKREEFIRKFGTPPDRVWFHVKETKNTISLILQYSQYRTSEAKQYVDKITESLLVGV